MCALAIVAHADSTVWLERFAVGNTAALGERADQSRLKCTARTTATQDERIAEWFELRSPRIERRDVGRRAGGRRQSRSSHDRGEEALSARSHG
jgi:hypothetical protein